MKKIIRAWTTDTNGATAIEYSFIAAGISLSVAAFIFAFGIDLGNVFETMSGYL